MIHQNYMKNLSNLTAPTCLGWEWISVFSIIIGCQGMSWSVQLMSLISVTFVLERFPKWFVLIWYKQLFKLPLSDMRIITISSWSSSLIDRYRKENPGTLVGMPGRYQGLNGGVILMDLNKIRQSKLYKLVFVGKKSIIIMMIYSWWLPTFPHPDIFWVREASKKW